MEVVRRFFHENPRDFMKEDMAAQLLSPPSSPPDDCTRLVDAALRNMIHRAQQPKMTEMRFKRSWLERLEQAILDDCPTSKFWLGLFNVVCGMEADSPGGFYFNGFVEEVFECLNQWPRSRITPLFSAS